MNDVPPGNDKTGVRAESAPGMEGANKVPASPRPGSAPPPAREMPAHSPDATIVGALPPTWLDAATALTANGFQSLTLPPGIYRVAITTATAVYAALTSGLNRHVGRDCRNAKPRPAKPISIIAQVELFGHEAASQHVEHGCDGQHDHKAPVLAISKEQGDCFDYLLDHCGLRIRARSSLLHDASRG